MPRQTKSGAAHPGASGAPRPLVVYAPVGARKSCLAPGKGVSLHASDPISVGGFRVLRARAPRRRRLPGRRRHARRVRRQADADSRAAVANRRARRDSYAGSVRDADRYGYARSDGDRHGYALACSHADSNRNGHSCAYVRPCPCANGGARLRSDACANGGAVRAATLVRRFIRVGAYAGADSRPRRAHAYAAAARCDPVRSVAPAGTPADIHDNANSRADAALYNPVRSVAAASLCSQLHADRLAHAYAARNDSV